MRTPDRFAQMVERQVRRDIRIDSVDAASAVSLLRRQHAATVRLVQQKRKDASHDELYRRMCDDILAALARYKKGTP